MTCKRFITFKELKTYGIAYSRKHLLDLMRANAFPKSFQLSPNRIAWAEEEILEWLATRSRSKAVA